MRRKIQLLSIPIAAVLMLALLVSTAASASPPDDGPAVDDFKPILTLDNQRVQKDTGRLMVVTDGSVTQAMLEALADHGTVHGWIERYNIVAVTPHGRQARKALEGFSFVASVEKDRRFYLTDVGTWSRDILDVTDVEETGAIGAPDAREVAQTGAGVHVAVIDTGLPRNWRDFLVDDRVDTALGRAFMGGGAVAEDFVPWDQFHVSNPDGMWHRDTNGHGMAVASHVVGFEIGPFVVDGAAPGAKIIPLKVFPNGAAFTWSSRIIGAIAYVTNLKDAGEVGPVVINMSLGGSEPGVLDRAAINDAIDAGVIVVSSAGNSGENGMGWPGAYPEVISAGATGWTQQFRPGDLDNPNFDFWWTQDVSNDPDGTGTSEEQQSYVPPFSSRAIPSLGTAFGIDPQELDVMAPGLSNVAPFGHGPNAGFFFIGGTSLSSPLTAGVAALMLEKDGSLTQAEVESTLKSTALPMAQNGSRAGVLEPFLGEGQVSSPSWDTDCSDEGEDPLPCDPVGAGLLQADAALDAIP